MSSVIPIITQSSHFTVLIAECAVAWHQGIQRKNKKRMTFKQAQAHGKALLLLNIGIL